MPSFSRLSTVILGRTFEDLCPVSLAPGGVIRTGGDRGFLDYAAALINVNESTVGLVDPLELVGRNNAFLENEAAVEAPFAGLDHAIGFLRKFIEGKSLDRAH